MHIGLWKKFHKQGKCWTCTENLKQILLWIFLYAGVAQLAEQLICNQQVVGSSPITSSIFLKKLNMGRFPSGQRGQTVNLLLIASVVRIHPSPPWKKTSSDVFFQLYLPYGKLYSFAVIFGLRRVILCFTQLKGKYNITETDRFQYHFWFIKNITPSKMEYHSKLLHPNHSALPYKKSLLTTGTRKVFIMYQFYT